VVVASSVAAQTDTEKTLAELCADRHPCLVINGAADETSGGGDGELVLAADALARSALAATDCPRERDQWAELGMHVDAFMESCAPAPRPTAELLDQLAINEHAVPAALERQQ
jgi:hypothetical protein